MFLFWQFQCQSRCRTITVSHSMLQEVPFGRESSFYGSGFSHATALSVSATHTAPWFYPLHHWIYTLPANDVAHPRSGQPAKLQEHGHREAQNSHRHGRSGRGGELPPDELLHTRMAEWEEDSGPGWRPEVWAKLLLLWEQGRRLLSDTEQGSGRAAVEFKWRGLSEGQEEIQQNQRNE